MFAVCRCLLHLGFRVCSYDLVLLAGCEKWFLVVLWVTSVDVCFVYGLGFVHMVCSCLMVMHVCENWFLALFWVAGVKLSFV